jgi:hypothetical protein
VESQNSPSVNLYSFNLLEIHLGEEDPLYLLNIPAVTTKLYSNNTPPHIVGVWAAGLIVRWTAYG